MKWKLAGAALSLSVLSLCVFSPSASAETITTFTYDMQTLNAPGTTWAEASITVDPTGVNTMGWLMAYADGENFIQIGWWQSPENGVLPFWENWSPSIYPYYGASALIPQSGNINVAIANEPGSDVWDLYLQEGPTWVKVYQATTSFSASQVQWKLGTEAHDGVATPVLDAGAGFNTGAFTPYVMGGLA